MSTKSTPASKLSKLEADDSARASVRAYDAGDLEKVDLEKQSDSPSPDDIDTGTAAVGTAGPAVDDLNKVKSGDDFDEVFAKPTDGGVDYRSVSWTRAAVLLVKAQFGMGVLAVPAAMSALGAVTCVIIILVIAALTTYGGMVYGQFRFRHRSAHSVQDIGFIMGGKWLREAFAVGYWGIMVFSASGAILSLTVGMNVLSDHATCTIVFVTVAAVVVGAFASIRTLNKISWLGWIGLICITTAVFIVTIAVGVEKTPAKQPPGVPKIIKAFGQPTFQEAMANIVQILTAYAASPAFLPVIAEMRDPKDYPKALYLCQGFVTVMYIAIGIVVYYYAGQFVASPALSTAGPVIAKVSYAISLVGLLASSVIFSHVSAKPLFVRFLKGSKHLQSNSLVHWSVWLGCVFFCVFMAWILALLIPFFDNLIGLIGALFGSFYCLTLPGWCWLWETRRLQGGQLWRRLQGVRQQALFFLNWFMVISGLFLLVGGVYGTAVAIQQNFDAGLVGRPFSCANNV